MSSQDLVTKVLLTTGAVFTVGGVGLLIAGETTMGVIFATLGVTDLLTVPFVSGRFGDASKRAERDRIASGDAGVEAEGAKPEGDPSYNPYARED
jgi:hypothetical protein